MFNRIAVESARIDYERQIAAHNDLSQFAPRRQSISERMAARIARRRQSPLSDR
jgi:hypothetical protein